MKRLTTADFDALADLLGSRVRGVSMYVSPGGTTLHLSPRGFIDDRRVYTDYYKDQPKIGPYFGRGWKEKLAQAIAEHLK